jgi:subtilisin-like proprotein convertase family protein
MKKMIGIALGLIVVLSACGDGGSTPTPVTVAPTPAPTPTPAPVETTVRYASRDVPKDIPNNTRTTSTLAIPDRGTILDISVDVTITHTWRGDVDVYLRHPDGTMVDVFRGNPPDSRDDVVGVFTIATAPQLASILNKDTQGTWTLVVDDTETQDKGRLLDWALVLRVRR